MRDTDEGREAGTRRQVREARDGHRLARSPDRDADAAHQRADGAPALAPQGPLLTPRAPEARRAAAAVPELPAEERPRGLSRPHQGVRPAPLAPSPEGGSSSEPFAGADSSSPPFTTHSGGRERMSIVESERPLGTPVTVS